MKKYALLIIPSLVIILYLTYKNIESEKLLNNKRNMLGPGNPDLTGTLLPSGIPLPNPNENITYSSLSEIIPGYTSRVMQYDNSYYQVVIYPSLPKKLKLDEYNLPCIGQTKAYKGSVSAYIFPIGLSSTFDGTKETTAFLPVEPNQKPVSIFELGSVNYVEGTEQDGMLAQLVPASTNPKIDVIGFAERISCKDTKFTAYVMDPKFYTLRKLTFIPKNGSPKDFIIIPYGSKIPQRDDKNNMIEDSYISDSTTRKKTRYKFDKDLFAYIETDSWVQ